jgi:hypothetical protein
MDVKPMAVTRCRWRGTVTVLAALESALLPCAVERAVGLCAVAHGASAEGWNAPVRELGRMVTEKQRTH